MFIATKMASITNSGKAGSFTSAYDFELGEKEKIDGCGQETMLKKISSTTGDMYEVMLDGTEFIITARADCLTQFETESESESRSTSIPTKSTTKAQSDDIPNFVNQQKNTNTLSKHSMT